MKSIIVFVLFITISFSFSFGYEECTSLKNTYDEQYLELELIINNMNNVLGNTRKRLEGTGATNSRIVAVAQKELEELKQLYDIKFETINETNKLYDDCISNFETSLNTFFNDGYESYLKGDFENSINNFKQYLSLNGDINNSNYKKALNNLILSYQGLGEVYFNKDKFDEAIKYYKEVLNLDSKNFVTLYNIGLVYYNKLDYKQALIYAQNAYEVATYKSDIDESKKFIVELQDLISIENSKKTSPSNDPLSYMQYYLDFLNIPNAWKLVTNNNQVIVAVIDDGININHPDLIDSIWSNPKSKYGESKIIDFSSDISIDNLPVGEHGTMIAGIIGASINNKEGIAGIAKNVKIMPIKIFNFSGKTNEKSIIGAIEFAIDNGANIINLSLGSSQFKYSNNFDDVILKAYKKGIPVVIAAGNGDLLSNQNVGVNLTNNPISPICNNNGNNKYSIGVYATDTDGYRTNWTNYGNCSQFSAPGVDIVSTSIPVFNSNYGANYNMSDGTSFSAPMIAGVIALGYNQYGYVDPLVIYDSLLESLVSFKYPDGQTGYKLDAAKYIIILGEKHKKLNKTQYINQYAENVFNKLTVKFSKLSKTNRITKYNQLLVQLKKMSKNEKNKNKKLMFDKLESLINNELRKLNFK